MSEHKRGTGEEAYAQLFQFKGFVPQSKHEELRDFLYKVVFNLEEAYEYLQILKDIDGLDYSAQKTSLLFRINAMGLICFSLSMRRLADKSGKRSLQKFTKFLEPSEAQSEKSQFAAIYAHYEDFINKGIAHQDEWSTKEVFESFPNSDIIEADLKHIEEFYYLVVNKICYRYARVVKNEHTFADELKQLL